MYRVFVFWLATVFFIQCTEEKLICDTEDPVEELEWLKAEIEQLDTLSDQYRNDYYITQGEYQGNTVFVLNNCCELCNTYIPVFNCSGTDIRMSEDISLPIDVDFVEYIWIPENSTCNLQG